MQGGNQWYFRFNVGHQSAKYSSARSRTAPWWRCQHVCCRVIHQVCCWLLFIKEGPQWLWHMTAVFCISLYVWLLALFILLVAVSSYSECQICCWFVSSCCVIFIVSSLLGHSILYVIIDTEYNVCDREPSPGLSTETVGGRFVRTLYRANSTDNDTMNAIASMLENTNKSQPVWVTNYTYNIIWIVETINQSHPV